MVDLKLKTDPKLEALIERARKVRLTKEQVATQRAAYVYGLLPKDRPATRADIRETLEKMD